MLCRTCYGQHWIIHSGQIAPCPECGGIGEVHCCDGLSVQPGCPEPSRTEPRCAVESVSLLARRVLQATD